MLLPEGLAGCQDGSVQFYDCGYSMIFKLQYKVHLSRLILFIYFFFVTK